MVITKSSKLITHRTASKIEKEKQYHVLLLLWYKNTAKENRNKDPPLYKINRPSFLSINVQAQELALIQVLKRVFIHALNLRPFDVSTDLFTICCEIEDSLCFEDFSKFDVAVKYIGINHLP